MNSLDSLCQERHEIDCLDRGILELLVKRAALVARVGEIKRGQGLPIRDTDRERAQFTKILALCKEMRVPADLTPHLLVVFRAMIESSVVLQGEGFHPKGPLYCVFCRWNSCGIVEPPFKWPVCPCCRMPLVQR